jgi:hypothetical protein
VTFDFTASDSEDALKTIESELKEEAKKHGGLPSWLGAGANVWLVEGKPWIEVIINHDIFVHKIHLPRTCGGFRLPFYMSHFWTGRIFARNASTISFA